MTAIIRLQINRHIIQLVVDCEDSAVLNSEQFL